MAYHRPSDLDGYIALMGKSDMRLRAQLAEDLVTYLGDCENTLVCMDLGLLIDGLIPWLGGSHFKIAQRALEALTELIGRLGNDFSAYSPTVLPHVVDRLGDSRDTVREKAQLLLHKLMESKVLTPQQLLDKLTSCFKHKNAKIREEFLQTIVNTLNEFGSQALSLKLYIQPIVILLGDPTVSVRDAAIQTLVEIYKHVGDRLLSDLKKKDVPSGKMLILEQKFDEIRNDGLLLPSALTMSNNCGGDEPDTTTMQRPTRLVKRTASAATSRPKLSTFDSGGDSSGAVTAEIFEASFEVVPQLSIFGPRDLDEHMKTINTNIGDKNMDWVKRVDSLKKIRSLLLLNIQNSPSFIQYLKDLSISFLNILKELRSQVIREACITIAYMCKTLKNRIDQFCVYILQELINLIQNSAKVIASSGNIALRYVIKYTHAPKLVPIIVQNLMQSKSKDIRSALSDILVTILDEWQTKSLDKNSVILRDAIKKGTADADNDARKYSRRAFWSFKRHFPDLAESLYNALDAPTQRAIEKDRENGNGTGSMSASLRGSNSSLNSMPERRPSFGLKSPASASPAAGFRSISAVDTAAAQRATARAQYSSLARLKISSGTASLQGYMAQQARVKKPGPAMQTPRSHASPEHTRTVGRAPRSGVSQSQPTSRSTSPSSRLKEVYSTYSSYKQTGTVPKKGSGIPRSLANSRETSPTRSGSQLGSYKRPFATSSPRRPERPPINPQRPLIAQRILQQSREAENALADALSPDDESFSADFARIHLNRKISRDESDESEASSICSERSFDSYRRANDSYSWNGSRSRLDNYRQPIDDIEKIINSCASTHWSERKDGLISLTQYLTDGKTLTKQQLDCILDLFRKMFMDTHTKVYALFLDTVNELILAHSNDLHDWLFILLTRLFTKLGGELLGSMHGKIWKTLKLVYEYFPADLQMQIVFRIIIDSAQTPTTKTKLAILTYLTTLASMYCTERQFYMDQQQQQKTQVERAILKILQYSLDQKSTELRHQARLCIVALYNFNAPNLINILSGLPKTYQDTAKTIIHQNLRRSPSGTSSPSSPLSCSSPKPLLSPQSIGQNSLQNNNFSSSRSRQSSVEGGAGDPMNSEEIYRSLRKTTAEIQNYSFETKLDRDANSKDSGISQMGDHFIQNEQYQLLSGGIPIPTNGINGHINLEKEDSCNGSKTQSSATTESNTPENTVRLDAIDSNVTIKAKHQHNHSFSDTGEFITEIGTPESDIIKAAICLTPDSNQEHVVQVLLDLSACIKYGNCELPVKNFKVIMKMLLNLIGSTNEAIMISALKTLSRIICSNDMKQCWSKFLELILLKIIDCYKTSKEASREIDIIIPKITLTLPLDISINILNPVIATDCYPSNLCAVKLLSELIYDQGKDLTDHHLDIIMPNIARLTDHRESMMRKAAVFCIVKLYITMGEEKVKPKFSLLNASKIRLLNVYITKAQNGKTVGGAGAGKTSSTTSTSSS